MKEYSNKEHIGFDDILLIPQHSEIESRKDVDLSVSLGRGVRSIRLKIPIVAAPMDTVCESDMAIAIKSNTKYPTRSKIVSSPGYS